MRSARRPVLARSLVASPAAVFSRGLLPTVAHGGVADRRVVPVAVLAIVAHGGVADRRVVLVAVATIGNSCGRIHSGSERPWLEVTGTSGRPKPNRPGGESLPLETATATPAPLGRRRDTSPSTLTKLSRVPSSLVPKLGDLGVSPPSLSPNDRFAKESLKAVASAMS